VCGCVDRCVGACLHVWVCVCVCVCVYIQYIWRCFSSRCVLRVWTPLLCVLEIGGGYCVCVCVSVFGYVGLWVWVRVYGFD